MDLEHISWRMFFIRIVEIIFIVNIAILDILALQNFPSYKAALSTIQTRQVPAPSNAIVTPSAPPTTDVVVPSPVVTQTTVQTVGPKEIFVPLGTGESSAASWTNVPGVIASVNSTNYPSIEQVTFEANVNVPTANQTVWVQLYNMTAQHPVWNSQISMTGATQYIVSPPITLDPGNNLYQVQMYTQLQYPALLTQSRIHIILQ